MNIKERRIDVKKIGQNIRKLRKERGLKQGELGNYLDVKLNNVSRWERGEVLPSLEMAWRISRFFNVSIDSLVE
jgi:transcriptional regulator with XRE-family HTH domain